MSGRYLEDIQMGDRFESTEYEVSAEAMKNFAREFDPQLFHLDEAAAEKTIFGGLTASGWHTAAIGMRLFVTCGLDPVDGAVGLGVDEMRWPTAVRPGDRLRATIEILATRPSKSRPGFGIVELRNTTRNQRAEVVLTFTANALIRRRPQ